MLNGIYIINQIYYIIIIIKYVDNNINNMINRNISTCITKD